MSNESDLLLADMNVMATAGPLKINPRLDEARVRRWEKGVGWGWLNVSATADGGLVVGEITDTGRSHLALQRVPEPIEGTISPWIPITEPITLAVLGKLGEECCELGARLFRTVIQGLDEQDPDSKRSNWEEISREIADVEACIQTIKSELEIDYDDARVNGKRNGFQRWFKMIREDTVGLSPDKIAAREIAEEMRTGTWSETTMDIKLAGELLDRLSRQ